MVLILVPEAANFPNCFANWHPKFQCSGGQFGKKNIRCKEFLTHLYLAILKILFCKRINDLWDV